jgi:hypothetical protein
MQKNRAFVIEYEPNISELMDVQLGIEIFIYAE